MKELEEREGKKRKNKTKKEEGRKARREEGREGRVSSEGVWYPGGTAATNSRVGRAFSGR